MAGLASRFNRRLGSSLILVVFELRSHFVRLQSRSHLADSVALCAMRFEVLLRMQVALEKTRQSNRIHHDRAVAETAQALTSRQISRPPGRRPMNDTLVSRRAVLDGPVLAGTKRTCGCRARARP